MTFSYAYSIAEFSCCSSLTRGRYGEEVKDEPEVPGFISLDPVEINAEIKKLCLPTAVPHIKR